MQYRPIRKRIGTFLPILILALILSSSCNVKAKDVPGYVCIRTGASDMVYVEFKGSEMRLATSMEGLAEAKPIKFEKQASRSGTYQTQYPEVALPLPPPPKPEAAPETDKKPSLEAKKDKDPAAPKMQPFVVFTLVSRSMGSGYAMATIVHRAKGTDKATWEYLENLYTVPAATVAKAQPLTMADMKKLSLELTTQPGGAARMGIAVQVTSSQAVSAPEKGGRAARVAPRSALSDIRKNRKSVKVSLTVLDSNGKEVASKKGTLSDFAFG